ncbi:DUF362 domain-containing protein [Halopenitus salinus]|jgi:hypothetical protein|uniref:DUF362 domain-containing protein n=1 Tax=Halopenitus salinus TaxID=1198295 RepID=A0ABD5URT0_9EURY
MSDDETKPTDLVIPDERVYDTCGTTEFPRVGVIEQRWETDPIPEDQLASEASAAVSELDLADVPAGGEVAVGAGSRGIANVPEIVRGVVEGLSDRGYEPFVFPAMGSHGGATAEGQRDKLAALGVTEEAVGCEVRATMETEIIGETDEHGIAVHADANAAAADAIVPVNRVKPHTDFDGDVESGLSKMLVIGMGKQKGAQMAHRWALDWSFRNMLPEIASLIIDRLPVVGGVAIVEDLHDDTTIIEGVPPEGFLSREAELLEIAYEQLPTLPFDELDVLVLDRMGKDISGPGMDPNVLHRRPYEPEPILERPRYTRVYTRSLTEPSHGNTVGIGLADLVHEDLLEAMEPEKGFTNAVTASTLRGIRTPTAVENDRAGLTVCLSTIGVNEPEDVRLVRALDTMRLGTLVASEALVEEAREREDLRVVSEPEPIDFEDDDFLEFP